MKEQKMKTMKMIKIVPVVLLGLLLSGNVRAGIHHNENDTVPSSTTIEMESWMFDTNYLSGVAQSVESWMMDENWLDLAKEESTLECWMMDNDYLDTPAQSVEPWMLDSSYLKSQSGNVN